MKEVALFWKRNHDWWEFKDGIPVLKDCAPQEARESYARYLEQMDEGQAHKIDCNWQEAFAPQILARGKQYFEAGRVSHIIQYGNRITAHVGGTEDYCVEVELPGGVPDSWLCTCPYAVQGNCKHKAALLFAIDAGEYIFTGDPPEYEEDIPRGNVSLPWHDAVEKLPADTLRRFLLDYADHNLEIWEYLSIWYLHGLPDGLLDEWKSKLYDYATSRAEGRRYVAEEEVPSFLSGVRSALFSRLLLLRKVGATMDAFYWLGTAFEIASRRVNSDAYGDFEAFYEDCIDQWDDLFNDATDEQRDQMLAWFWDHHEAFFSHANYEIDVDFLYYPWTYDQNLKSLEIIDGLLANCRNRQKKELLIDCRLEVMDSLDYPEEAVWDYLKQHLDLDYTRRVLLARYHYPKENRVHIAPFLKQLKEMDANDILRLAEDQAKLIQFYLEEAMSEEYNAERVLLLTKYRQQLAAAIPNITSKPSARQFIICLDSLHSLKDQEVDLLIEELVDQLCSNPAIARKGIVEMVNVAGYEWPKAYRFPE